MSLSPNHSCKSSSAFKLNALTVRVNPAKDFLNGVNGSWAKQVNLVCPSTQGGMDNRVYAVAHAAHLNSGKCNRSRIFTRGLDSFLGNAVFLETRRPNTILFSAASLLTGLLFFGEPSGAVVLQATLSLLVFFRLSPSSRRNS